MKITKVIAIKERTIQGVTFWKEGDELTVESGDGKMIIVTDYKVYSKDGRYDADTLIYGLHVSDYFKKIEE